MWTDLDAGQYVFVVRDDNNCEVAQDFTMDEPTLLIADVTTTTDVSCYGGSDGTATVYATGGTTPYGYAWSNGQTTVTATGLSAGTHSVTVTDANGCQESEEVVIGEPDVLSLTENFTINVSCYGGSDGYIYMQTNGGTAPYNYNWGGPVPQPIDNAEDAQNIAAGTYSVTVTDANGCTDSVEGIVITEPTELTVTIGNVNNADCAGNETGSATATAAGGTGSYTYAWSNGDITATATALHAGGYSVTATDANGCTAQASVSITDPTGMSMEVIQSSEPLCNGDANGSVTLAIYFSGNLGGTPPYTLNKIFKDGSQISAPNTPFPGVNGNNPLTVNNLSAGQYAFIVVDNNGCEVVEEHTVDEPTLLIAEIISSTRETCLNAADGTATVNATGGTTPYTYLWSDGQTTYDATGFVAGTYTVTVTDANDCEAVTSVVIGDPDTTDPIIESFVDLTLNCSNISSTTDPTALITQWLENNYVASDETELVGVIFDYTPITLDICTASTTVVTWTATDACGNTATATSNLIIVPDETDPILTIPAAPLALDCQAISSTSSPAALIADWLAQASATDDCDNAPSLTHDFNMGTLDVCAAADYSITVTWTATDACGNDVSASQTIDVTVDATAPTLTVPSAPLALDCQAISSTSSPAALIADWLAEASATDGCDNAPVLTHDFNMGMLDVCAAADYSITVTWTATDACGNDVSDSQTIDVTVDATAPTLTVPASPLALDCGAISSTSSPAALIDAWLATAGATDGCDNAPVLTHDFNMGTLDVCAAADYSITVTWTATDACGNDVSASQTIDVTVDATAPTLTVPSAPLALDCQAISSTSSPAALIADWLAEASATDGCDNAPVLTHDFNMGMLDVCAAADYSITVTWTATDACGNDVSDSQTIDVTVDATAPTLTVPASPLALDCGAISSTSSPAALIDAWLATAGATDGCDNAPVLTHDFNMGTLDVCAAADYSITVTWTATDACGNDVSASQTIDVTVDATAPTLTVPSAPLALDCQAISSTSSPAALIADWLAEASATDGCDNAPVLTHDFNMGMLDVCAAADYSITVTWTATDACGNDVSDSQTIDVTVDATAPTLTVPASPLALDCGAISSTSSPAALIDAWLATAGATDGCDNAPVLTHDFNMGTLDVCAAADYSITVTWTATDACGNDVSASQTIDVTVDATAPTLTVPSAPLALDCQAISSTSSPAALIADWLAEASATDGCDNAPVLTHDFNMGMLDVCAAADYSITVTWTATDACGNDVSDSQTIDVTVDATAPTLTVPASPLALDCGAISSTSSPAALIDAWLATAGATDGCDNAPVLTHDFNMGTLDVCAAADYSITVTWTATDACGNDVSASQTIDVTVDATAPTLTVPSAPLALDCQAISSTSSPAALIADWLAEASATDGCDNAPVLTHDFNMGMLDVCAAADYSITVTWTATDACGNDVSDSQTIDVTVDATAPTLTVPASPLALDCGAISSTSSPAALIDAWLATAGATDGCDNAPVLTHDFNMGTLDVCAAADYSITVTWTATDACGNDVSASQTIDVTVDATAPTLTVPSAPLALDCQAISSTSSPAALIADWLAEASATDGCDNAPVLTHDFNMGMLDVCAAADYSITVTWTATDACGNDVSDSQTIDVTVDATAPTLTVPASPLALDCGAISSTSSPAALIDAWLATAGATDGCDNAPVLTHDFNMGTLDVCAAADYSITVTWTATDACGNDVSASQTIDVTVDATAPTLTVPSAPLALDCQAISSTSSPAALIADWLAEASATDGCDNAPVLTHDFNMGMLDVCAAADYSITVTWTATDACGNDVSDSQTIDVTVDATAPTLTVPASPLALDCGAISSTSSPAALIDAWLATAGATDGCDNAPVLTHDFNMGVLDICAPADYSITVTWTATDACGNDVSDSQTIDVTVDVTAPVVIAPADITVDCEDISNTSSPAGIIANFLAGATASDDCASQVTLTYDLDNTALNVCSPATSNFCATPVTHFGGNPPNSTALLTVENVGGNIEVTATSGTSSPIDFLFIEGPGFTPVSSTTVVDGEITVTIPFAGTPPATFEFQALWSLEDFGGNWQLAVPSTFASTPFSGSCSPVNSNFCSQSVTHFGGNPANSEAILTVENVGGNIEVTATSGTSSPIDFLLIEGPGFTPVASTTVVNGEIKVTIPFGGTPPTDFEFQALWSLEDFGGNWQLAVPGTFASTPFNGTCIGAGDNIITVTWTATDDCGNTGTATSTITVEPDTEAPMIDTPADVTLDADVNCNALLPDYTSNPATDNCDSDVQVTQSPLPGTVLSLGTTEVTLTATDNCGNFTDVTFDVTVEDNTNPVALCQDFTVQLDATGNATITAADVNNGSYDNCSVASVAIDISSFTCADLGSDNQVTLTVTDGAGNTATCISNVTVEDNIAPTFTCPSPVDVQGCDGLVPDLISTIGDEMDNCGVVTLTQNPLPGVSIGNNGNSVDVVITATDASGNATSCTVTVTVVDDTAPVFQNCPAAIAVANDPDQCGAIVSWIAPVALDNCVVMGAGSVVLTAGMPSGSVFPVGTSTVTYTATDDDGNTATCTFDITVSDTEAPEFITTLPADETVECDAIPDPFVVIPMMHTADNCTESMNIVVDYGEEIIDIICANTYTIVRTWTITDEAGNSAVHKQKVYVQDTTAPTFTVPADVTIECDEDTSPANTGDVTDQMDNCSAPADIVVAFTDVEDLTGCGGYTGTITRTWTATDECGNVTTQVQVITIEDTTGPDAVCQNITVELDENGEVTISANQINNGSTDNCAAQSALTLSLSKSSFTCADIGENIVTLTVTDPCGNIGTCVATVTVEDNIAPVITCPGDMTIHLDPGACEQVISYDVLATDNCDVTVEQIAGPYGSGDGFPIGGPYVLTYEATDEGGNTAQCSFTVTVFEYVPTSNDMTCNSLVNLSLDENCEAIITADQILEGNNYGCYDDYIITSEDANGNVIPGNILDITHVGTTITVTITDPVTGVNCWGLVYVEDKLIPEFDCPADITIACSENAVPALTGEPVITSCELSHTVTSVDVFTDFGQCADPRAQIERTWTVTDDSGNSATCVQIITIAAVDLADVTFPADLVDANALRMFRCCQ